MRLLPVKMSRIHTAAFRLLTAGWQQTPRKLQLPKQRSNAMLQPGVPAWFEIPVADIERAQRFYEAPRGLSMKRQSYTGDRAGLASVEIAR